MKRRQAFYVVNDGRRYYRQYIYLKDKREALAMAEHFGTEVFRKFTRRDPNEFKFNEWWRNPTVGELGYY